MPSVFSDLAFPCSLRFPRPSNMLAQSSAFPKDVDLPTTTIRELQDHLAKGHFTSVQLVEQYLVSRASWAMRLKLTFATVRSFHQ